MRTGKALTSLQGLPGWQAGSRTHACEYCKRCSQGDMHCCNPVPHLQRQSCCLTGRIACTHFDRPLACTLELLPWTYRPVYGRADCGSCERVSHRQTTIACFETGFASRPQCGGARRSRCADAMPSDRKGSAFVMARGRACLVHVTALPLRHMQTNW